MKNKIITLLISVSLILSSVCLLAHAANWQYGDVNGDGRVTANDARLVLRVSARLEKPFTGDTFKAADANNDGIITASDARQILRWSARLDTIPAAPTTKPQETTTKKPSAEESTTKRPSEPPTSKKYKEGEIVSDYPESIGALLKGSFYMEIDATDFGMSGDELMAFAVKGNNTEVRLYIGGMGIGLFITKSATYMKFTNIPNGTGGKTNNYVFDENALGISLSDLFADMDIQQLLEDLDLGAIKDGGDPVYTSGSVGGKTYDTFTFTTADGNKVRFYTDSNEDIIKIEIGDDQDDTLLENIRISAKIPSDMLTLNNFRDDGNLLAIMVYFADLME